MRDLGQQFYQIKFKPKMEGVHTLSILHKDAHIVGSPFQFTVGVFSDGGAHKASCYFPERSLIIWRIFNKPFYSSRSSCDYKKEH